MIAEHEYHVHRGAPVETGNGHYTIPQFDDDKTQRVHSYANEDFWTVEVYGAGRILRFLEQAGAVEKPCLHDGRLFVVDAHQLIEAFAAMAGLIIEFRTRRRPQYSEETRQRLRERMAAINAQK